MIIIGRCSSVGSAIVQTIILDAGNYPNIKLKSAADMVKTTNNKPFLFYHGKELIDLDIPVFSYECEDGILHFIKKLSYKYVESITLTNERELIFDLLFEDNLNINNDNWLIIGVEFQKVYIQLFPNATITSYKSCIILIVYLLQKLKRFHVVYPKKTMQVLSSDKDLVIPVNVKNNNFEIQNNGYGVYLLKFAKLIFQGV
ncbi:hypothetical protein ACTA71_009365 [Dictyostelium dimigraforme]